MTRLDFNIEKTVTNAFGYFIVGRFLEVPPIMPGDQKFRLSGFEYEVWGVPQAGVWTLKLLSERVMNAVLDEQTVRLELV